MEKKVVTPVNKKQPLVLIVDDDEIKRYLITAYLAKEGYAFLEAINGEQGLQQAREHTPDVIIVDMIMPRMNGFELSQHLQRDPATAHIPLIAFSMMDYKKVQQLALEAGIGYVIPLGAEGADIVRMVQAALTQEPDPFALSLLSFESRLEDVKAELYMLSAKLLGISEKVSFT